MYKDRTCSIQGCGLVVCQDNSYHLFLHARMKERSV